MGLLEGWLEVKAGFPLTGLLQRINQNDFVPIEVKAGSLVVIHGDLIHQRLVGISHCNSF